MRISTANRNLRRSLIGGLNFGDPITPTANDTD